MITFYEAKAENFNRNIINNKKLLPTQLGSSSSFLTSSETGAGPIKSAVPGLFSFPLNLPTKMWGYIFLLLQSIEIQFVFKLPTINIALTSYLSISWLELQLIKIAMIKHRLE